MSPKTTDKKSVTDAQLTKLAQPLIKEGLTPSAAIKKLRANGYSFNGKRVRVLFESKPAPKPAKKAEPTGIAKGKGKPASKPATKKAKAPNVAKVSDVEAGLGIQS